MTNEEIGRRARRAYCIAVLGGQCVECGTKKALHIDHILPRFKVRASFLFTKYAQLMRELRKCQLLCPRHHQHKTLVENYRTVDQICDPALNQKRKQFLARQYRRHVARTLMLDGLANAKLKEGRG